MSFSNFAPFSRAVAYRQGVGVPAIEVFSSALVGNGVTDDSAAIMAAHDAAYAAGVREVWVSKQHYAPTAYNLGNVIFRGPGALIGTYRKKVVPISARAFSPPLSTINPAVHLRATAKAVRPTVVIYGDSTGTDQANHSSLAQMLWPMLQKALIRDNPGRSFNFVNRSIGGTDITQYQATGNTLFPGGVGAPSWFSNLNANWLGYVSNQSPDLVILNWGTNSPTNCSPYALQQVVAALQAFTKVPDILVCTNLPRGTQADTGVAEVAALEGRDFAAGSLRSYCEYNGVGFIDLHRMGCMARDGFDPCAQETTPLITSGTSMAFPAVMAATQGDFDLTFTIDNTGGQAFGSGQKIDIYLSSLTNNYLRIGPSGSVFQLTGASGPATTWLSATNTSVSIPSGVATVEVSVRGNQLIVYLQSTLVLSQLFTRGGGAFSPQVVNNVGTIPVPITVTYYANSTPALIQPILTDEEMFGTTAGTDGNGINHPAAAAYNAIHEVVVNTPKWGLLGGGKPTQAVTAAATINPDAASVQLTGPASGTYAITLAAPRAIDAGSVMMIEMVATTGTNTVTLALTNVTGGTASTTCTWNAAAQKLVLMAGASKWEVIKQDGVTLA